MNWTDARARRMRVLNQRPFQEQDDQEDEEGDNADEGIA